jgi:hypothetical protein
MIQIHGFPHPYHTPKSYTSLNIDKLHCLWPKINELCEYCENIFKKRKTVIASDRNYLLLLHRYACKNYGLVMTGQAAAAPVLAVLTQFLSPLLGWQGMFSIIATFSLISAIMNLRFFPKNPTPKLILARLERPAPSEL